MLSIKIDDLVKKYKNGTKAIDNLNLEIKEGEIFSLLGPNGAGKSSLINILTTYYKPTYGKIYIFEKDLYDNCQFVRKNISCVSQNISIDLHLSLVENMIFQSKLYNINKETAKKRIEELIDIFNLSEYLKFPVSVYSGGIKRKIDIAVNLISMPKILFLDEPTTGLDVISRKNLWNIIKKINKDYKTTIFLTTHYLEEAEFLSDSVCIMKNGKKLIHEESAKFKNHMNSNIIHISFFNNEEIKKYKNYFEKLDKVNIINTEGNSIFLKTEEVKKMFVNINKFLLEKNINFRAIEIKEPTLEDIFLNLINS